MGFFQCYLCTPYDVKGSIENKHDITAMSWKMALRNECVATEQSHERLKFKDFFSSSCLILLLFNSFCSLFAQLHIQMTIPRERETFC